MSLQKNLPLLLFFIFLTTSCTSLHDSIRNGDTPTALEKIRSGSNLNKKDKLGNTPLHIAALRGNEQVIRVLLKQGANPRIKNMKGELPAHLVFQSKKLPAIRALLEATDYQAEPDHKGNTLLHLAIMNDQTGILSQLLQNKENLAFKNDSKKTPVELMISPGKAKEVKQSCTPDTFPYFDSPRSIYKHIQTARKDPASKELHQTLVDCKNRVFPEGREHLYTAYHMITNGHRYRYKDLKRLPEDVSIVHKKNHIGAKFDEKWEKRIPVFAYLIPKDMQFHYGRAKFYIVDSMSLSEGKALSLKRDPGVIDKIVQRITGENLISGTIKSKNTNRSMNSYNPSALKLLFEKFFISPETGVPYSDITFGSLYRTAYQDSTRKNLDYLILLSRNQEIFLQGYEDYKNGFHEKDSFTGPDSAKETVEKLFFHLVKNGKIEIAKQISWTHSELAFLYRRKMDGSLPAILEIIREFTAKYDPNYARKLDAINL